MKKEFLWAVLIFTLIAGVFFYKIFLRGFIPFPGDLLIAHYNPWKTYSYLGYVPGSYPTKDQYFDVIRQMYPWQTFTIESLKSGVIPLWNPYNFAGAPLLANFQSAIFYPLHLLYLVLPQIISWTILVILQPVLAGIFTYLFAREIGLGKIGSFLSAIAFSYSLFMTVFIEYNTVGHTILWLPLSLLFLEKLIKRLSITKIIFFTASISFIFLAGHLQLATVSLIFIAAYGLFRFKKRLLFFSLLLIGLGLSSIQLIPAFELISNSARSAQPYTFLIEKLLLQPQQMISFISPDFFGNPATRNYLLTSSYPGNALYIGLTPLIFAFFSLVIFKKNFFVKFFALTSLIIILIITRTPLTEIFYKIEIPLFSTSSPKNMIFLLSFSLSLLAGFGIEQWINRQNRFYQKVVLIFAGIFIFCWSLIAIGNPSVSTKNFLYSTILFAVLIGFFVVGRVVGKKVMAVIFIIITLADLFYFFQKFNPFAPKELVFPQAQIINFLKQQGGIDRFWGYGAAGIEANFATQYKIFSPDGYDPLYPRWYGEFIQGSGDGKIDKSFTNKNRSDAIIIPGFGQEDLAENLYRLRVLDLLGVKYVLDRAGSGTSQKTFPIDKFKLVYDDGNWRVFLNLKAAPRIFIAKDYKIAGTKEEFASIFFSQDFDPTKTIILEKEIEKIDNNDISANVEVISYSPNKIELKSSAESNKLLFLSDTYYPGWKAFIDNAQTEIYRADYAFRSVVVPSGKHKIEFIYQPQSFSLGVKTSIISLILLIVTAILIGRKKHEN